MPTASALMDPNAKFGRIRARCLARKRVTVIDYPDGRLAIRHNGIDLPYRTFDSAGQPGRDCREQAPRSRPGLHCREAEGTRHVSLGQGAAPSRPKEPYV
jgi:hypothetical protein